MLASSFSLPLSVWKEIFPFSCPLTEDLREKEEARLDHEDVDDNPAVSFAWYWPPIYFLEEKKGKLNYWWEKCWTAVNHFSFYLLAVLLISLALQQSISNPAKIKERTLSYCSINFIQNYDLLVMYFKMKAGKFALGISKLLN